MSSTSEEDRPSAPKKGRKRPAEDAMVSVCSCSYVVRLAQVIGYAVIYLVSDWCEIHTMYKGGGGGGGGGGGREGGEKDTISFCYNIISGAR